MGLLVVATVMPDVAPNVAPGPPAPVILVRFTLEKTEAAVALQQDRLGSRKREVE